MHIETECPRCHTRFRVQPALAGKPMRCPADGCRTVFVVRDVAAGAPRPTPAPHGRPQQSGSVGDLIPILPAEQAAPGAPPERAAGRLTDLIPLAPAEAAPADLPLERAPSWHEPPPVRRPPGGPPEGRETVVEGRTSPEGPEEDTATDDGPRVFQPGAWERPAVRRGAGAPPATPEAPVPAPGQPPESVVTLEHDEAHEPHRPRGRWARWVIVPFFVAVLGGLGAGV